MTHIFYYFILFILFKKNGKIISKLTKYALECFDMVKVNFYEFLVVGLAILGINDD